jgi:hypothetical protein
MALNLGAPENRELGAEDVVARLQAVVEASRDKSAAVNSRDR